jgi:hypothetical protein
MYLLYDQYLPDDFLLPEHFELCTSLLVVPRAFAYDACFIHHRDSPNVSGAKGSD